MLTKYRLHVAIDGLETLLVLTNFVLQLNFINDVSFHWDILLLRKHFIALSTIHKHTIKSSKRNTSLTYFLQIPVNCTSTGYNPDSAKNLAEGIDFPCPISRWNRVRARNSRILSPKSRKTVFWLRLGDRISVEQLTSHKHNHTHPHT